MSTETNTAPEVKPAITEADVVAFYLACNAEIRSRNAALCEGLGFDKPTLTLNHYGKPFEVCAWKSATYVAGKGDTILEAESDFVAKMNARMPNPAKLRAEAQALLAEAEKIEAAKAANKETAAHV